MLKFFNSHKNKKYEKIHIDLNNIPCHIAIIMDGNGRWAKERNLPRIMGHKAGVEAIREIVKECSNLKVKYLTLYAFSTENWKRPKVQTCALPIYIHKLPYLCQEELITSNKNTKNNTGLNLNLALNYGGRDEIVRAFKLMYKDIKSGKISEEDITEHILSGYLYTKNMPDPDLIIRPSGEQRLSNFLLWQCAYSEFWYSDINWPDFKIWHLHKAILDYQNRDRRFGTV